MGVYIKDMDMPNSCMACPLFSGNGCRATKTLFAAITNVASRVNSCPLTEVHEPHGRLIDIEDTALLKIVSCGGLSTKKLWKRIKEQPTVIERSK